MLQQFASYAVAQRAARLPDDVVHAAARAVVDWVAATLPGASMPPARILTRMLVDEAESGRARLIPGGRGVRARTAALVNGTASHTAELDDIYRDGLYHPGSPTVAAALAVAEEIDASGADLLRAVTIGYEISGRIAAAVQPAHYRYWHTTGTVGTLGAAAAVAELLELDAERFAHALATATTMAAGLQQAFRSDAMSKPLHAGRAAEAGVLAAMAAGEGLTGALDVLDGPAGFGAAMGGSPDFSVAVASLGKDYCVRRVTVKSHSCCGHTFAAVDAALLLRAQGLRLDDIERIQVETYGTALQVAGNPDPTTAFEAKFSLPYCVAAALVRGTVRLSAFAGDALGDPAIRALTARVTLTVDPEFDALYPTRRAARVRIIDRAGAELVEERRTRKGDPDDPVTDEELRAKFDELATSALGPARAAELADGLWGLPGLASVRQLDWTPAGEGSVPR